MDGHFIAFEFMLIYVDCHENESIDSLITFL